MSPASASDNLRVIDALRRAEEMIVTMESTQTEPLELKLQGAALFAKPMGAELDTCIQEYADLNG